MMANHDDLVVIYVRDDWVTGVVILEGPIGAGASARGNAHVRARPAWAVEDEDRRIKYEGNNGIVHRELHVTIHVKDKLVWHASVETVDERGIVTPLFDTGPKRWLVEDITNERAYETIVK